MEFSFELHSRLHSGRKRNENFFFLVTWEKITNKKTNETQLLRNIKQFISFRNPKKDTRKVKKGRSENCSLLLRIFERIYYLINVLVVQTLEIMRILRLA